MKKLFVLLVLTIAFNSCSKETVHPNTKEETQTVYFYVEAVDLDGTITSTQVVSVRYKPE